MIIHHPNVIHSGGLNIGTKTRVSIEIRLFDQKKFDLKKNFDPKLFLIKFNEYSLSWWKQIFWKKTINKNFKEKI